MVKTDDTINFLSIKLHVEQNIAGDIAAYTNRLEFINKLAEG